MPRWRTRLRTVLTFVALGLALELVIALASTALVDLSKRGMFDATSIDDAGVLWRVSVARGPAGARFTSARQWGAPWSPERVLGPPDTPTAGDLPTAWASATQDGLEEWLELHFAEPITATTVQVFESYNPGATKRVSVEKETGSIYRVSESTASTLTSGVVVRSFALDRSGIRTRSVKLHIDSRAVPGWNEIDAVCLVDHEGRPHWATAARASTWYGSGTYTTPARAGWLAPSWSNLHEPLRDFASGAAQQERRVIEARGWPAYAIWGELDVNADGTAANTRALPLRPIWLNLLADAAILGGALWLLGLLTTRPLRFLSEAARARRGSCVRCGYDLQFDLKHGCPECGWRR